MSMRDGAPPEPMVTPHSFACCTTFSACACSSSALVGMQPHEQAGPAERLLFLDDGDREAELRGADGGDVAAGAGADHDDVVFVGHHVISRAPRRGVE